MKPKIRIPHLEPGTVHDSDLYFAVVRLKDVQFFSVDDKALAWEAARLIDPIDPGSVLAEIRPPAGWQSGPMGGWKRR